MYFDSCKVTHLIAHGRHMSHVTNEIDLYGVEVTEPQALDLASDHQALQLLLDLRSCTR